MTSGVTSLKSIYKRSDSIISLQTPIEKQNDKTTLFKIQRRANSILLDYSNHVPTSTSVTKNPNSPIQKSSLDNNSLPIIFKNGSNLQDRIFLRDLKNPEP